MWFCHDPGRGSHVILVILSLLCVVTGQPVSHPTYGLDVSVAFPLKTFECLKKAGYEYVIARAWKNTGEFDDASLKTLSAALAGGFDQLDIYFYPCPRCASDEKKQLTGDKQIETMMKKLHGHKFGNLWIDVEDMDKGSVWHKDTASNREFMDAVVEAAIEAVGKGRVGIYAAKQYWETIFGTDYTSHADLPLWTVGFDDRPNFDDWKPFGGWCSPVMKQYTGNADVCGVKINKNIGLLPSAKPRWEPSCWTACHDDEQSRTGKCIQQGKEVSKSLCSHEIPFVSTRKCPYKTPLCDDLKEASCKNHGACRRTQRLDGMCENAPAKVCCSTKKPPPSSIRKKRPAPASPPEEQQDDEQDTPTPTPKPKKTAPENTILKTKNAYSICKPPRHVGICRLPSECVGDDDIPIGGYCKDDDMTCCARKTKDD